MIRAVLVRLVLTARSLLLADVEALLWAAALLQRLAARLRRGVAPGHDRAAPLDPSARSWRPRPCRVTPSDPAPGGLHHDRSEHENAVRP